MNAQPAENAGPVVAAADRLMYRKADLVRLLGIPQRTLDRAIATGEFPRADKRLGRVLLWSPRTVKTWTESTAA